MILNHVKTIWGPKPNLVKWMYTAIVRPRILYAYHAWGHKATKPEIATALQKINNLTCKMITPVRHTTPRKSLEIIYDVIPLNLQGDLEALSTHNRHKLNLKWQGKHPTKTPI